MTLRIGSLVNYDLIELRSAQALARNAKSGAWCVDCKHFNGLGCPAFPGGGIPLDIRQGFTLHTKKDKRQTGDLVFERK